MTHALRAAILEAVADGVLDALRERKDQFTLAVMLECANRARRAVAAKLDTITETQNA